MNQLTPIHPAAPHQLPRAGQTSDSFDAGAERWITLSDLIRIAKIHRHTILMATYLAIGIATATAFAMTPLYLGSALVMVDEQQNHVVDDTTDPSVLSGLPADPSSIASQVEILKSHALAGEVVDKLKLTDDPEFNGAGNGPVAVAFQWVASAFHSITTFGGNWAPSGLTPAQETREKVIGRFLDKFDAFSIGHSTVIEIDFRSENAEKAARIANAMANTYVQDQTAAKAKASQSASLWLTDRVSQLARQAGATGAAVQQYKAEHGLIDTSAGTPLSDQQLGDLTSQLITAEGNQAEAQAKVARVRQLVNSGHSADVTEVVDSQLITQLREQEATLIQQKADLASHYGPLHPKMQVVEAQLRELGHKINDEVNRVVGTVQNDAAVMGAHVAALKHDMENLNSTTNGQNEARVKLAQLQADATSATALYQAYLQRLKQTQQQASLKIPDVHVTSPAAVPLHTSYPKKLLIIGASIPAGLLLGFMIALMKEHLYAGFRSADELESALGLSVLATLPEIGSKGKALSDVGMQVVRKPNSQFTEALHGLEISLSRVGDEGSRGRVLLVTSALPGEGKTSTAASLARHAALSGHRVVVVDADLRRPRVAAALGLRKPKRGLVDYLARNCTLDEVLTADQNSPLVAIAASETQGASAQIASPEMRDLMERLRDISDLVIIDSPPVLAVHDAKKLAPLADSTLFVVRWGKTPREATAHAIKSLQDFGIPLLGVALVRAHPEHYQYYTYGYTGVPSLAGYYQN